MFRAIVVYNVNLRAWPATLNSTTTQYDLHNIQPLKVVTSPKDLFKLKFDGAKTRNLGPTRFGGVFHNSQGDILYIYAWLISWESNNATELHAPTYGI